MSEIIERVALAILAEQQKSAFPNNLDLARAAIAAIRELPGDPGPRYAAGNIPGDHRRLWLMTHWGRTSNPLDSKTKSPTNEATS